MGEKMAKETIKCPQCGFEIEISQIIAQDIEVEIQEKYDKKMQKWKKEFEDKEEALKKQFEGEKKIIEEEVKKEAVKSIKIENEDLRERLKEKDEKLEMAQKQELELRKIRRNLEEDKKNMELESMRKLDKERQQIEEKAKKETEESHRLKDLEKDKQLSDMRKQIEELKRKAEWGSQKIQGMVMETELEKILRDEFHFDEIEPVSSGVKGADVIQTVKTQKGQICGKILWESKRTKSWSDTWIQKMKDDQRDAKANVAVIVSKVLPKGLHHFREIGGVWVSDLDSAISLGVVLRTMLIQVAKTQELQTGKEEKKEIVYNYLIGPEFRNRVQAITEAFIAIKNDLDTERRAMENIWAKREKQLSRVVSNIAGMRGDLEGIVGPSLPSIKILELSQGE